MRDQFSKNFFFCLVKYIENYVSPWKMFLDPCLERVGRKFVLKGQFDPRKISIFLPVFFLIIYIM